MLCKITEYYFTLPTNRHMYIIQLAPTSEWSYLNITVLDNIHECGKLNVVYAWMCLRQYYDRCSWVIWGYRVKQFSIDCQLIWFCLYIYWYVLVLQLRSPSIAADTRKGEDQFPLPYVETTVAMLIRHFLDTHSNPILIGCFLSYLDETSVIPLFSCQGIVVLRHE